ncbi:MAG: diacylglycerol kinase [Planctomycetia bacterium]
MEILVTPVSGYGMDFENPKRTKRPWKDKFHCAFKGIKAGMRGQSSFFVHFFMASLVIASALVIRCDLLEWALLIGCIALVMVVELINSAMENLYAMLPEEMREGNYVVLDIAAGAVLLASIFAVIIGSIVFIPKFIP